MPKNIHKPQNNENLIIIVPVMGQKFGIHFDRISFF